MLSLQSTTPPRWLAQVDAALHDVIIDHAHCEKKAAGVAMNLLFSYVDHVDLARSMTEIVNEELEHFRLVLDILERRGIPFRKLKPSSYGARLHELIRKDEPGRAVDRLLIAGLIEARSCERFKLLSKHMADVELQKFYYELMISEAGHYVTFIELAKVYQDPHKVSQRWQEWLDFEAKVMRELEVRGDRMH